MQENKKIYNETYAKGEKVRLANNIIREMKKLEIHENNLYPDQLKCLKLIKPDEIIEQAFKSILFSQIVTFKDENKTLLFNLLISGKLLRPRILRLKLLYSNWSQIFKKNIERKLSRSTKKVIAKKEFKDIYPKNTTGVFVQNINFDHLKENNQIEIPQNVHEHKDKDLTITDLNKDLFFSENGVESDQQLPQNKPLYKGTLFDTSFLMTLSSHCNAKSYKSEKKLKSRVINSQKSTGNNSKSHYKPLASSNTCQNSTSVSLKQSSKITDQDIHPSWLAKKLQKQKLDIHCNVSAKRIVFEDSD